MTESYVVIPDVHGEYDAVSRVVDANIEDTDKFLFLGDVIGGPQTAKTIALIRQLGDRAITIVGNHEWICRNALSPQDDPQVDMWRRDAWRYSRQDILQSYGIQLQPNWDDNATLLRQAMTETGDFAWLNTLPPYYETDQFVAVHAGPQLDTPWVAQAAELDAAAAPAQRLHEVPAQIFDMQLAQLLAVPAHVDNRRFVTGHSHSVSGANQRIAERRICLASPVAAGKPLYVYHSQSSHIQTH